ESGGLAALFDERGPAIRHAALHRHRRELRSPFLPGAASMTCQSFWRAMPSRDHPIRDANRCEFTAIVQCLRRHGERRHAASADRWVALTLGFLVVLSVGLHAQTSPYTVHQHKALYLFNFAKYTEWPKEAFADDSAPFVLGILGEDPFRQDLDIIKGKTIKGRKLVVKYFHSVQEVT